jgi:hypothetical protein
LGVGIDVSDDEMERTSWTATYESTTYTFKPSYKNEVLENGNYVMNSDGSAYARLSGESTGKYYTTGSTYADAEAFATAKEATAEKMLYTDADGKVEATSWANAETTYYTRIREKTNNDEHKVTPQLSAFRPYFATSASSGSRSFFAKKIVFDSTGGFGEGPETVLDGSLEIYTRGYKIYTTSHMKEATTIRIVNAAGAILKDYVLQPGETIETPVAVSGVYVVNKKKVFVEE